MVDQRKATRCADRVGIGLQGAEQGGRAGRLDDAFEVNGSKVYWRTNKTTGDFLAWNQNEVGVRELSERGRLRNRIVVRDDQEVVAAIAVPLHDRVGRTVTVGVNRVRVRVAFEPAQAGRAGGLLEANRLLR